MEGLADKIEGSQKGIESLDDAIKDHEEEIEDFDTLSADNVSMNDDSDGANDINGEFFLHGKGKSPSRPIVKDIEPEQHMDRLVSVLPDVDTNIAANFDVASSECSMKEAEAEIDAAEGHEEKIEGRGILIYVLIYRIFNLNYLMKEIWKVSLIKLKTLKRELKVLNYYY